MAAYEALFARIGDLGGGVLSGLIGSPGLPEICSYPHSGAIPGCSGFVLLTAFEVFMYSRCMSGKTALGVAPASLGLY